MPPKASQSRKQKRIEDESEEDDDDVYSEESEDEASKRKAPTKRNNASQDKKEPAKRLTKKRKAADDDLEFDGGEQQKAPLDAQEKEIIINDFMRFALFMDSKKLPIKREDVNKNVIPEIHRKKKGLLVQHIIPEAKIRFEQIFGFELIELERHPVEANTNNPDAQLSQLSQKSKKPKAPPADSMWILRLKQTPDVDQRTSEIQKDVDGPHLALLMVILCLTYARDGPLPEEDMWDHLKTLGLVPKRNHPVFGYPEKVIDQLIKELYLEKVRDERAELQHKANPNAFTDVNQKKTFYVYKRGSRVQKEMNQDAVEKYLTSVMRGRAQNGAREDSDQDE
ncbi:hypothetical protein AKO1_006144 [Acrasis kona]|uniref:MAGE domain-containing protein n=1 Tax=Acrasis kona TaxID=1008807 RepID=A0AAW2YIV1_9EUKA